MKKIKYFMLLGLLASFVFSACEEDDFDPGGTAAEELAGEWFVQTYLDGEVVAPYLLISTFNTAANVANEVWIDDLENIWPFKVRANADVSSLTFSGNDLTNVYTDTTTVTIQEGKIVTGNSILTPAGNPTDSIYLRLEFSDDPGNVYEMAGYRRTGFIEDEH